MGARVRGVCGGESTQSLQAARWDTHTLTTHPNPLHTTQSLLRAIGLFVGGIIISRNFGEAFNV